MSWDSFQKSSEYILWKDLFRVAEEYSINEDTYFKKTDLSGEFWEPFLDRLYKMGSILGFTKKLKEIRMDWMRPILYFGAQSTGVIEFDGRRDEINKGAISNAILVKFSFKSVINAIHNFKNLDEKNFHKEFISFKKDIKYYFIQLAKFVKDGFLTMHRHVKLILKPLLDLRRGGYRLFSIEQMEKENRHLTIFHDKKDLTLFMSSSQNFFEWERYKQSKDPEGEKLNEFINQNISQEKLSYHFSSEKRVKENNDKVNPYETNAAFRRDISNFHSKQTINNDTYGNNNNNLILPKIRKKKEKKEEKNYGLIIFPNIRILAQPQPNKLKHEAYQLEFENGLNSMIYYLNSRQNKDFPYIIDSHKIFTNINYVPNGKTEVATNFYISKLIENIEILKEKCYEMKLNGLSRVLMPITENVEFIKIIKNIFDYHVIIDNVMGNYLLFDQYMFIYNAIKFLLNSSKKVQVEQIKERYFMEEAIPKYVFFQSLCHSVKVLEKFKKYYKYEKNRIFQYKDSYQISEHILEHEDNELIFAYEIYGPHKRFFVKELQERKKKYDKEVNQFGRFWLMEGFFNKDDKNLWIEAIEALSNINELVREDIRDSFLNEKEEKEKDQNKEKGNDFVEDSNNKLKLDDLKKDTNISNKHKDSSSSSLSSRIYIKKSEKKNINLPRTTNRKKTNEKGNKVFIKKKIIIRQQSLNSVDFNKLNIDSFRPPKIWNYPIYRLRKLKKERSQDTQIEIATIRNVDPTKCYVDGRIERFNKLFDKIYNNMKLYWTSGKKADTWEYFYDKVLKALNINYKTDLLLKRERIKKAEEEKKNKEQQNKDGQNTDAQNIDEKNIDEINIKKDEEKQEDKKDEKDERDGKQADISIKTNTNTNNFINSDNTFTTLQQNTNNTSISVIKKLKIKPKIIPRNPRDEKITNETTA